MRCLWLLSLALMLLANAATAQTIHFEQDDYRATSGESRDWIKLLDIEGQQTNATLTQEYAIPPWARTIEWASFCTGGTLDACTGVIIQLFHRPGAEGSGIVFGDCVLAVLGANPSSALCVVSVEPAILVPAVPWDAVDVANTILPGNMIIRLQALGGVTADNRFEVWVKFQP